MRKLFRLVFFNASFPTVSFFLYACIYTQRKDWVTQNSCRYFIGMCMNVCIYGLFFFSFLCNALDFIIHISTHLCFFFSYIHIYSQFSFFFFFVSKEWLYFYINTTTTTTIAFVFFFFFLIDVVVMYVRVNVGTETIGNVWRRYTLFEGGSKLSLENKMKLFF